MNPTQRAFRLFISTLAAGVLLFGAASHASLIIGVANHPDAQLARTGAPGYGLRLNGYFLAPEVAKYTFDFEHAQSDVALHYDGSRYSLLGSLWGGLSKEYQTNYVGGESLWSLEWYMMPGLDCPQDYANCMINGHGTLRSDDYGLYELSGMAKVLPNDESFEFAFINGFRGFNAATGWGWLTWLHVDSGRSGPGDFMFVKVPEPGTLGIIAIGLIALAGARRASR